MKNLSKLKKFKYNGDNLLELVEIVASLEKSSPNEKWRFVCHKISDKPFSFEDFMNCINGIHDEPVIDESVYHTKEEVVEWIAARDCDFDRHYTAMTTRIHRRASNYIVNISIR